MSEANLVKLDKALAKQLNKPYEDMRSAGKKTKSITTLSQAGSMKSGASSVSKASKPVGAQTKPGAPSISASQKEKDEWAKIVDYDYQQYLAE